MKILITGGAGFIGSNFIYYILEKYPHWEVVCVDALTYAANIHTLDRAKEYDNFNFIQGNITHREHIFQIFQEEDFETVVNFAAESHVDKSIADPGVFLKTNIIGTQTLMDASRTFGVKRYHQVSTDEVYGDLPLTCPELFFTEDSVIQPSSPYAASKAGADALAQSYFRTYDFPLTISRCSNNYGPYQFLEKLIPRMIVKALRGEKLPVHGSGVNVRDWLHVSDHCNALDLVLQKGKLGGVYNIGGHHERSNLQVVRAILKELGGREEQIEFVADRPGNDMRYAIDPTKMKDAFGWVPAVGFEEGLKETIRWYKDNESWWRDL